MSRAGARWGCSSRSCDSYENDSRRANTDSSPSPDWPFHGGPLQRHHSPSEPSEQYGEPSCSHWSLKNAAPYSIESRRDWEAYQSEMVPRIQFFKRVVERYQVKREASTRLALTLRKWQRAAQIESSLGAYQVLVLHHRAYYVRKALLRACWSHVSRAFLQWRLFTDQSAAELQRVAESYDRQVKRVALGKWYHRLLLAERLEQQAAASVWLRRKHQQTQAVARKLQRIEKLLLASYWISWRASVRKLKCGRSERRLRFQNRRVLVEWMRFVSRRKEERERRREPVRLLVDELIQDSVFQAQVKQAWVAKAQRLHLVVHVIERIVAAYQRRSAKQTGFRKWRAAVIILDREPTEPRVQTPVESRKIRLPERISALYQRPQTPGGLAPGAKRRASHRSHWR